MEVNPLNEVIKPITPYGIEWRTPTSLENFREGTLKIGDLVRIQPGAPKSGLEPLVFLITGELEDIKGTDDRKKFGNKVARALPLTNLETTKTFLDTTQDSTTIISNEGEMVGSFDDEHDKSIFNGEEVIIAYSDNRLSPDDSQSMPHTLVVAESSPGCDEPRFYRSFEAVDTDIFSSQITFDRATIEEKSKILNQLESDAQKSLDEAAKFILKVWGGGTAAGIVIPGLIGLSTGKLEYGIGAGLFGLVTIGLGTVNMYKEALDKAEKRVGENKSLKEDELMARWKHEALEGLREKISDVTHAQRATLDLSKIAL